MPYRDEAGRARGPDGALVHNVIIVGGGVGNIDVIYTEGLKSLNEFIFNNRVDVPILKPSLGDSAGVFGAAALVAPRPQTP